MRPVLVMRQKSKACRRHENSRRRGDKYPDFQRKPCAYAADDRRYHAAANIHSDEQYCGRDQCV